MLINILCPFLGSLGFALIYKCSRRLILPVAMGGLVSGIVYAAVLPNSANIFLSRFLSSFAAMTYCETCAKAFRAPATVFIPAALLPLLPGANLFYAMSSLVVWNSASFSENLAAAAQSGFGIAMGIMSASLVFHIVSKAFHKKN